METRILAGILQTDTHQRLAVAEEALEYLRSEEANPREFPELEQLVAGLAAWLSSSNFKVVVGAVDILSALVGRLKERFKAHIPAVFPALKERLGDAKDQVREQCQGFIQLLMREVAGSPQLLLERVLETGLAHKNWRVKDQALVCLTRTLNYFGSGQVSVSKFMGSICSLTGDANSQVRSSAVETIVEIYRHVGVKVRIDLSRRGLPSSRMTVLNAKFDAIDATTHSGHSVSERDGGLDDDRESVSSCGSSASARTFGSSRSVGSRGSRAPTRPHSAMAGGRSSRDSSAVGGVDKDNFTKAFSDTPQLNLFTTHDVEKRLSEIDGTLQDIKNNWEARVTALKELRSVAKNEAVDHAHLVKELKNMETAMLLSLKDLRSQITKEACVTVSYLATVLGSEFAGFAEMVMPQLVALLPNSAKVMANSAAICVRFIIEHSPSHRLLSPLANGFTSKSPITRKQCAEFLVLILTVWDTAVLDRVTSTVEGLLRRGLSDADPTARKHTRRAYWAYQGHYPSNAQLLFDSLDASAQKHLNDERVAMERGSNGAPPTGSLSSNSLHPPLSRKRRPLPSHAHSDADLTLAAEDVSPTHTLPPRLQLIRPTTRSRSPRGRRRQDQDPRLPVRPASSMGNLAGPPSSPARPSSRSGGAAKSGLRPSSRSGLSRTADGLVLPTGKTRPLSQTMPRSTQRSSPLQSPVSSPTRKVPVKTVTPLTKEALHKIYGGGSHDQESDDAGSVTSERSTFSFSSEVSINPYTKYPAPITDLNQLVAMGSSQQWAERRDGMAQLHMLLESPRPFSHSDMLKVKTVFKRMLSEPHIKVYGMFLDTLSRFIEEHREYLDDWLFLLLLRLLHKQGTDMLSSVHFKLTLVLEHMRKSFEPEAQLSALWRIVTDQSQPMNHKVRLGWLDYFLELLPALDSSDFRDTSETRAALSKLLQFTTEPKSVDVRRNSQKCVVSLFELNPATFTLMLRNLSKPLQESANRILRGHVADMSSSSGEESDKETTPTRGTPTPRTRRRPGGSPNASSRKAVPPSTPKGGGATTPAVSHLPPSGARGMRGLRTISSSTPDMRGGVTENGGETTPSGIRKPRSRIPTPRGSAGGQRSIPRRAESTTPYSTRPTPPTASLGRGSGRGGARRGPQPRAQSVDPDRMARLLQRPSSSRSDYTPDCYQNGEEETPGPDLAAHFSFSDLPHLDFGSPDEEAGEHDDMPEKDHFALLLKDLQTAAHSKARLTALQSLFTLCRDSPQKCKWDEHFSTTVRRLIELLEDEDPQVRVYALRVLREMLKAQAEKLVDYAEVTTLKVLRAFADSDVSVSQVAEDVFPQLAPALPSQSAISLLAPMTAREKYPMLLGTVKLLTKVISQAEPSYLAGRLGDIVPGVVRSYCHNESSVRKASVFCLVALHSLVGGEPLQPHLAKLSSSQRKLLDLYIKRSKESGAPR